MAAPLCALVGAYAAVVITLALFLPAVAGPLAICAALVLLALAWRARPTYGTSRGLPPGSLALMPLDSWVDHRHFQKLAARYGPVFKTAHFIRPMICVLGLERGHGLLRRHDRALQAPPLPFGRYIPAGFLRHMTHRDHRVYRPLFRKVFHPGVHQAHDELIRSSLARGLGALAEAGSRGAPTRPQLGRMLFPVWVRLFFGMNPDDPDFARLQQLYRVLDMRNPLRASDRERRSAIEELSSLVRRQSERCVPDCYLSEMQRIDPDSLDDESALRNLIFVLHTSWSDVASLLQWTWKMLADHPEQSTRIRAGDGQSPPLATRVVLETLRLEQSEHLYRIALEPIEFEGFIIPKGWLIRILVRESHRMPEAFDGPESFDPDRFLGEGPDKKVYAPFGALRHACLGDHLAVAVGTVFVDELVRGFEWRVTEDGPRELSRWRHWSPNARFAVTMEPRART